MRSSWKVLVAGGAALLVGLPLLVGAPGSADTRTFRDRSSPPGPHAIRKVRVDNDGPATSVTVRHRDGRWRGRVRIGLDFRRDGRPERFATLRRGSDRRPTFRSADGSPWPCRNRRMTSRWRSETTRLSVPRRCLRGAARLRAQVRVSTPGRRADTEVTRRVEQQSRPNIVMLMVDDMRKDDLRYLPRTRRLIGRKGATFRNAFSQYPLCCPARASVLTGLYAHNHRVWSHREPYGFQAFEDDSTVATWLQDAGYATTYLGKYLNGYGRQPAPGRKRGNSVRYVPPGWTDWRGSIDGGLPPWHRADGGTYRFFDTTLNDNGVRFDAYPRRYQTRVYARLADQTITRRAARARPFFSYVSFTAPHHGKPREPDDPEPVTADDGSTTRAVTPGRPGDVKGMYDKEISAPPGATWRDPDRSDAPPELAKQPPLNAAETKALTEATRQRAESLEVVDQAVARIIRALRETGELEETLVVFTSDNGYFLGEHGIRQGKILPYDPALRIPLLMRGPGIPAGAKRRDPFLTIDLAPTFADLAGVRSRGQVDGKSMLRVARRGDRGWRRRVLTETGPSSTVRNTDEAGDPLKPGAEPDRRFIIGLRTPRYLYTHRATEFEELYDLRRDPRQYDNVIDDPAYREVAQWAREEMRAVRACDGAECRDPRTLPPEPRLAQGQPR